MSDNALTLALALCGLALAATVALAAVALSGLALVLVVVLALVRSVCVAGVVCCLTDRQPDLAS